MASDSQALQREVRQLRRELDALRLWCVGLEQQQAQLAAVLSLTTPAVGRGLTRFPLGVAAAAGGRSGWDSGLGWPPS